MVSPKTSPDPTPAKRVRREKEETPAPAEDPVKDEEWTCLNCNMINRDYPDECEFCSISRFDQPIANQLETVPKVDLPPVLRREPLETQQLPPAQEAVLNRVRQELADMKASEAKTILNAVELCLKNPKAIEAMERVMKYVYQAEEQVIKKESAPHEEVKSIDLSLELAIAGSRMSPAPATHTFAPGSVLSPTRDPSSLSSLSQSLKEEEEESRQLNQVFLRPVDSSQPSLLLELHKELLFGRSERKVGLVGARVNVGDPEVSHSHCIVKLEENGRIRLIDLSMNGTLYRHPPVFKRLELKKNQVELSLGDAFSLMTDKHIYEICEFQDSKVSSQLFHRAEKIKKQRSSLSASSASRKKAPTPEALALAAPKSQKSKSAKKNGKSKSAPGAVKKEKEKGTKRSGSFSDFAQSRKQQSSPIVIDSQPSPDLGIFKRPSDESIVAPVTASVFSLSFGE